MYMQSDIRRQLIRIFSESNGEFVSGQSLSETLGCSRTAVWKHIEELRKDGYELEAIQRKGYRIIKKPDKLSNNEIQLGLKTKILGKEVYYQETVHSTQKIAHELANNGATEGSIVTTEEQTEGRGRLGRIWNSPKSSGIWMSIILRPNIPLQKAPQLTLLTAVSVVEGIKETTGIACQIKWPNDILINGKKVVGILTELQSETDRINAVIIGIGINVNQTKNQFPDELKDIATSLKIENNKECNRTKILQNILKRLENHYEDYLQNGFHSIKDLWEAYAVSIGKNIIARTIQGSIEGYAEGITDDGVLLLKDKDGNIHHIYSADIEINE